MRTLNPGVCSVERVAGEGGSQRRTALGVDPSGAVDRCFPQIIACAHGSHNTFASPQANGSFTFDLCLEC